MGDTSFMHYNEKLKKKTVGHGNNQLQSFEWFSSHGIPTCSIISWLRNSGLNCLLVFLAKMKFKHDLPMCLGCP